MLSYGNNRKCGRMRLVARCELDTSSQAEELANEEEAVRRSAEMTCQWSVEISL